MASRLAKIINVKRALTLDLASKKDNVIDGIVSGRVQNFRVMKTRNFIDLADGSTDNHLQLVLEKDLLKKPDIGSYITCVGRLVKSSGSQQNVEFKVDKIINMSRCDPNKYPLLTDEAHTKDGWYRRYLHLRPRTSNFASLLRVRSELDLSLHLIMKQMDFFKVQPSILTSNDSEASSDLFSVCRRTISKATDQSSEVISDDEESSDDSSSEEDSQSPKTDHFFNKEVFLASSTQLHLESLAASLSRVYCMGSTFRAENSHGPRHLCEFTMLEAEEANVNQVEQLMDRVETIIKFVSQYLFEVSEHKSDLLKLLDRYSHHEVYEKLANSKYIRMCYSEAISILRDKIPSQADSINFGKDINRTHERLLLNHCNNIPIFITNYPKELKPFYMKSSDDDKSVACFDLIAPIGGEICGGSLREDDPEALKNNIRRNRDINDDHLKRFDWYIQLREYGSFPHGGFGLGIERLVKSLIGIKNIKDTIPFPRWPGHCAM